MDAWPMWLVISLWVAWFALWRFASPAIADSGEIESVGSRASYLLPMLMVIVLMIGPGWPSWLDYQLIAGGRRRYWIGVGLLVVGLLFTVWARRELGKNWSGRIAIKENQQLVRTGPYRWIRHPVYSGGLIAILGTAVSSGKVSGLLALALACVALGLKIWIEERWLMREFGGQYVAYCRSSWMLLPFVV